VRTEQTTFKICITTNGVRQTYQVLRTQLPLTHANVRTAQSSQGLTFRHGVIVDGGKQPRMTDDIYWLNFYVMLSRATSLSRLLIMRPPGRSFFARGPPPALLRALRELQAKVDATRGAALAQARLFGFRFTPLLRGLLEEPLNI
jgi:hypothetical protein